ncbi:MAG: HAMP domain-containing sensor histidine kinase [Marmoricola sp.]
MTDRPSTREDSTAVNGSEVAFERQAAAAAVVAEAVALAMEAAAAEAAEAVLVTATAVQAAAGRAAESADLARQARASAAEAAAESVAVEAERTAASVRELADLAARRVKHAAWVAADELAQHIKGGAVLDTALMARILEATVRAAAAATDEDTTRAAVAVKNADSVAAAQVARTLAAADASIDREVTATAKAKRELAAATAVAIGLETEARAAGVALAAREAAQALLTDWGHFVDQRADLDDQALAASVGNTDVSDRSQEIKRILVAAAERDSRAELRDRVADERERAASFRRFGDRPHEERRPLGGSLPVQRTAAMDRSDALSDRADSASDRVKLSAGSSAGSEEWESNGVARMWEMAAELSHDLRVPLSSIIASVELLEDELRGRHLDESVAALLSRATHASDRMVRMLDQNMTLPAVGASPALPEVDLGEVARQFVLDSEDLLGSVDALVETGELPVVRADPDAMYSVLQNLITNSVKFARPGVAPRVQINALRLVDRWRISVRDNGVGLPVDSDLDVFSILSRGDSAVTGHGIGLATVARIVAQHGGRVGTTPAATGAEIWFELPVDDVGH